MPFVPDDLKTLKDYKKKLASELGKSKQQGAPFRYYKEFTFGDGTKSPLVVIGKVDGELKEELTTKKAKLTAAGRCSLNDKVAKFVVQSGSFKEASAVKAMRSAGMGYNVQVLKPDDAAKDADDSKVESEGQGDIVPKTEVQNDPESRSKAKSLANALISRHKVLVERARTAEDPKTVKRLNAAVNAYKRASTQNRWTEALEKAQGWESLVNLLESDGFEQGEKAPYADQAGNPQHVRWMKLEVRTDKVANHPFVSQANVESLVQAKTKAKAAAKANSPDLAGALDTLEGAIRDAVKAAEEDKQFLEAADQRFSGMVDELTGLANHPDITNDDQVRLGRPNSAFVRARQGMPPVDRNVLDRVLMEFADLQSEVKQEADRRTAIRLQRESRTRELDGLEAGKNLSHPHFDPTSMVAHRIIRNNCSGG